MVQLIPSIESTAAALSAERIRMQVVSQNIANANTTHGPDGNPYQRQTVSFETMLRQQQNSLSGGSVPLSMVQARIGQDPRPPRLVYEPGHPDADENGMVAMPNIDIHEEMVDLIAASRAFEANLAVVKNARNLALQTLAIGKRS